MDVPLNVLSRSQASRDGATTLLPLSGATSADIAMTGDGPGPLAASQATPAPPQHALHS